ncbi:MAG: protein-glutamate O-methyltransferase CheR [Myxococcota bacterium]
MKCLSERSMAYIADLVRVRSGIVVHDDKEYLVISRLAPIARNEGYGESIDALVDSLRRKRQPRVETLIIEAMTTNETTFYRDVHPFQTLRRTLLPELIGARRAERRLSVWSAASSTGQEIYTLAIILREHFPELRQWTLRLCASDLSAAVVARAREGRYAQHEVNRGLPAEMRRKYFHQRDDHWEVVKSIRDMVEFREVNLISHWPVDYPRFDLVLLRNVLIYFNSETKVTILQRLARRMAPGGVLMLGAAETTMGLDAAYERHVEGTTSFYRVRSSSPRPATYPTSNPPLHTNNHPPGVNP